MNDPDEREQDAQGDQTTGKPRDAREIQNPHESRQQNGEAGEQDDPDRGHRGIEGQGTRARRDAIREVLREQEVLARGAQCLPQ